MATNDSIRGAAAPPGADTGSNDVTSGASQRPFYSLEVAWIVSEKGEAGSTKSIDISPFVMRLVIDKSVRILAPIITVELRPTVRGILKYKIGVADTVKIKLWKSEGTGKKQLELTAEMYPAEFSFLYHRMKTENSFEHADKSPLSLLLYPTFFNKILAHPKNQIFKEPRKLDKSFLEEVIQSAFKNAPGKTEFDIQIDEPDNTVQLPPRFMVHKTPLTDYMRYLVQRYGLYKSATLFYADFPDMKEGAGDNAKPVINLKALHKDSEELAFSLVLSNTNEKYELQEKEHFIYLAVNETDRKPDAAMQYKTATNYLIFTRDFLYKRAKLGLEGLQKEIKDVSEVMSAEQFFEIEDFWKIEKTSMTNTIDNKFSHIPYYSDCLTGLRVVPFTPDFFFPFDKLRVGRLVTIDVKDPDFIQADGKLIGKYMIRDITINITRQSGGQDRWDIIPTFSLIRR